jgi:hypothetical protein
MVVARFAKSYVDRLYEAKDIFALWEVISVVGKHRQLPEEFSLFLRLWNWCCMNRCGVWQYYEGVSKEEFDSMAGALERFGLQELARRYRTGMTTWKEPECCNDLDDWIEDQWKELEAAAFGLIASHRDCLYAEN